jgi:hypothetical protein
MRFFILLILISSCCAPRETVRTETVHDTIIRQQTQTIKVPVKSTTIIENPCVDNELRPIKQIVKSESSTLTIVEKDGNLVIEQNIDSIVNSKVSEILKRSEKQVETVTITKTKVPKWAWWTLGVLVFYVVYRVLRLQIPLLRIFPI